MKLKRGEIWTAPAPWPQGAVVEDPEDIPQGKRRPVIVLQDDELGEELKTVTICPFTTEPPDPDNPDDVHSAPMRIFVPRNTENQLDADSWAKADWVTTMQRAALHERVGQLGDEDLQSLERAIATFLFGFGSKELGDVIRSWYSPDP